MIPRKNKGDPLYAEEVNQISAALRMLDTVRGGNGVSVRRLANGIFINGEKQLEVYWGTVTNVGPASEADFTNNRYWVQRSYISNDEDDADDAVLEITKQTDNTKWDYAIVPATNIAENVYATHGLKVGTLVRIVKEFDIGDPTTARYWFEHTEEQIGQYLGMAKQVVADNQSGYDWVMSGPLTV